MNQVSDVYKIRVMIELKIKVMAKVKFLMNSDILS